MLQMLQSNAGTQQDNHRDDRNFDAIAEHFSKKVYGGLKGQIRLAVLTRDLQALVTQLSQKLQRPLRILDVGAGLAQLSLTFAQQGHMLTINDISKNMLHKAQQQAEQQLTTAQQAQIKWHICSYQQLNHVLHGQYDLIMSHALLEWLAEPEAFVAFATQWLTDEGHLSLCFYNSASFVYRNLVMGNFNLLNTPNYQADNKKSLTPNHPVDKQEVFAWLREAGLDVHGVSGLRVFHDYSPLKRGGHQHPDEVIKMELRYSNQDPFMWLGRYLHVMAGKNIGS